MRRYIIIVSLMLVVLSGCDTRRKVLEGHGVVVKIDWTNLKAGDTQFDKMELHFYDEHGNHIIKQSNENIYTGDLPVGNYSLLVFNSGAHNVNYESLESYSNAQIRTPSLTQGKELMQPDNVYGCSVGKFTIKPEVFTEVTAFVKPYVSTLNLNVELTGEVHRVVGCRWKVSGIADRENLASHQIGATSNDYTVISENVAGSAFKSLTIFGTDVTVKNMMDIELTLDDGETIVVGKDVTDDIKSANDPLSPNIDITAKVEISRKLGNITATIIGWVVGSGDANVEDN